MEKLIAKKISEKQNQGKNHILSNFIIEKAHVKQHTKKTKSGKLVNVKEHEDKRNKKEKYLHEMSDKESYALAKKIMKEYNYEADPNDIAKYLKKNNIKVDNKEYGIGDFYSDNFLMQDEEKDKNNKNESIVDSNGKIHYEKLDNDKQKASVMAYAIQSGKDDETSWTKKLWDALPKKHKKEYLEIMKEPKF